MPSDEPVHTPRPLSVALRVLAGVGSPRGDVRPMVWKSAGLRNRLLTPPPEVVSSSEPSVSWAMLVTRSSEMAPSPIVDGRVTRLYCPVEGSKLQSPSSVPSSSVESSPGAITLISPPGTAAAARLMVRDEVL